MMDEIPPEEMLRRYAADAESTDPIARARGIYALRKLREFYERYGPQVTVLPPKVGGGQ